MHDHSDMAASAHCPALHENWLANRTALKPTAAPGPAAVVQYFEWGMRFKINVIHREFQKSPVALRSAIRFHTDAIEASPTAPGIAHAIFSWAVRGERGHLLRGLSQRAALGQHRPPSRTDF